MYTTPSIKEMIEIAMRSLDRDVAPELTTSRARVCLELAQSLLQVAKQRIDQERVLLIAEHNEMTALYRTCTVLLQGSAGAAAERIAQRAARLGGISNLPLPLSDTALADAHRQLSVGLVETLTDLDELIGSNAAGANEALQSIRAHLVTRSQREFQIFVPARMWPDDL